MKHVHFCMKAAMLFVMSCFLSCSDVVNENYPTTTIGSLDVTAKAYPGVNVITWNAVKDAATYSVYRTTVDGQRETCVMDERTYTYYVDTDVNTKSSYRYRVIAHPVDSTVHDAAQRDVSLTTQDTWPTAGTEFLKLAQSESGSQSTTSLSASSISATLLAKSGSTVRVSFPVKPYARYTVTVGQPGGASLNEYAAIDSSVTVQGFNYTETATVDVTALFSGEKEVTIVATPYSARYISSTVTASSHVTVSDISKIASAIDGNITVTWTNYENGSKTAYTRVRFSPVTFDGKELSVSDYSVYRAIPGISDSGSLVYSSITKLTGPTKDIDASTANETVYYCDDRIPLSEFFATEGYFYYYVVLKYEGSIKTKRQRVENPSYENGDWNFYPPSDEETSSGSLYIRDLMIDAQGRLHVEAFASTESSSSVQFSYGYFSTYNQALSAVERELSNKISLNSNYGDKYYSGMSFETLGPGYYAFRLVDGSEQAHTIIAYSRYDDGVYWLEIRKGSLYNSNILPKPEITSISKEFDQNSYTSVTLNYSSSEYYYDSNNMFFYRIYRATSSTNSPDYIDYHCIATTTERQYVDTRMYDIDSYRTIELGQYVFYKVETVKPYYYAYTEPMASERSDVKFVCALKAPSSWLMSAVTTDGNNTVTVTWNNDYDWNTKFRIGCVPFYASEPASVYDVETTDSGTVPSNGCTRFAVQAYYSETDSTGGQICSKWSTPVDVQYQSY